MALSRFEIDTATGSRIEIQQVAYRNENGDALVLDVGVPPPDGYEQFTPDGRPSYEHALSLLTEKFQSDVEASSKAFALAYLADGASQTAKQDAIRDQYTAIKNQYTADKAALKIEYGV